MALAEVEYSRVQMAGDLAKMKLQRDDAVQRAAIAEAKAARKVQRWTTEEKRYLTTFFSGPVKHPTYAVIAAAMVAEFGRSFTAATVGAQARRLGLVVKVKPAPTKAARNVRRT